MPLFLAPLVPYFLGGMGLLGAGKAVSSYIDNSDAQDINKSAENIIMEYNEKLNKVKKCCNEALKIHGEHKLYTYNSSLDNFVKYFKILKNVELVESKELGNLQIKDFNAQVENMAEACNMASSATKGILTGVGTGGLVAFGAYSGTMALGAAGTGAAISGLSGVASTNATLAWLGGGTIASGGGGIALGTTILGMAVAGPALFIFGSILSADAETKLNDAKSNKEKAMKYAEEVKTIMLKLNDIVNITELADKILLDLSKRLQKSTDNMIKESMIKHGDDFSEYPLEAKNNVFIAIKYAQLLKTVIDLPIIDTSGELIDATQSQLYGIDENIQKQESHFQESYLFD